MNTDVLKRDVAQAALAYIDDHRVIGLGSGSTVNYFIEALARIKHRLDGCVAGSEATAQRLTALGIPVLALSLAEPLALYIDGADEVTRDGMMIKGGGGALTREKIIASCAAEFICLVDESKVVNRLGQFPIAVEVIPLARSLVGREMVKLGGQPLYREHFITDNGNIILDGFNFNVTNPLALENALNQIPGVVENGVFARRRADKTLVAYATQGVSVLT
jgi:ribose 5-phosphate isomerase A